MHVVINAASDANINRLLGLRTKTENQLKELWADYIQRIPVDHERMNNLEMEVSKLDRAMIVLTCITAEVVL